MDVKFSFLNGLLKEEVYVEQPLGYEVVGEEHKVYQLKRSLYGLKESLNEEKWCNAMDEEIYAIERNETWELTTLLLKKQVIEVK